MDAAAQTLQAFASLPPAALITLSVVFGCLIGSFLNVVAHRLPLMIEAEEAGGDASGLSLSYPASRCPDCGHSLSWYENIPLVSFLLQGGKCRHCGTGISWRYPMLEATAGVLAGLAVWQFGLSLHAAAITAFLLALLALTAIDLDTGLLPDRITLPLLWLGLIAAAAGQGPAPASAILGAVIGYLTLDALNRIARLLTGQDGMGGGDMKMAAMMGAWLGPEALAVALFIACASGAAYGVAMRLMGSSGSALDDTDVPEGAMPFGPWLALGAAILALWPEVADFAMQWVLYGSY
ncbi:MAG: prepilin peptidase [Alphaproteobacteria bacterium]|jgi:leader peptidase (prepilin peptidase) / N-methyltransferase|nr:prepilin peptidase [Alphaproteobacteria bacterium]